MFAKNKTGVYYCSKCMYQTSIDEFESIKWWLEMKKKTGYTKIGFCNNSIENHQKYTKLFDDHRDFVDIDQFDCLPNFYDNSTKYFLSYSQFANLNNLQAYRVFDRVFIFFMNECYWNNIDKYKYVSVMDRDEIIFPNGLSLKKNSDIRDYVIKSNDLTMKKIEQDLDCRQDKMEQLLDNLSEKFKKRPNSSFYFKNGIKFPNHVFQKIFDSLDMYFNSSKRNSQEQHNIDVIFDPIKNTKFTITISHEAEFEYTLKLLEFNRNVIKPYIKRFEEKLFIQKYNSFYVISGSSVHWVVGKMVHNTNRSLAVGIHYNTKHIDLNTLKIKNGISMTVVDHEFGRLSHFKKMLRLKKIPISQILPDLNYINCFFRPTVKKFNLI